VFCLCEKFCAQRRENSVVWLAGNECNNSQGWQLLCPADPWGDSGGFVASPAWVIAFVDPDAVAEVICYYNWSDKNDRIIWHYFACPLLYVGAWHFRFRPANGVGIINRIDGFSPPALLISFFLFLFFGLLDETIHHQYSACVHIIIPPPAFCPHPHWLAICILCSGRSFFPNKTKKSLFFSHPLLTINFNFVHNLCRQTFSNYLCFMDAPTWEAPFLWLPFLSKSQVSTKLCKTKQFAKNVADAGVFLVGLL